ncbi:hypothetical protein ABPG72_017535 [Tetrahymena utriculariae]
MEIETPIKEGNYFTEEIKWAILVLKFCNNLENKYPYFLGIGFDGIKILYIFEISFLNKLNNKNLIKLIPKFFQASRKLLFVVQNWLVKQIFIKEIKFKIKKRTYTQILQFL